MSTSRIPLYRVKGTHYECGHTVGRLAADLIRRRIADDLGSLNELFAYVQTTDGFQFCREFVEKIRSLYPWYWDEISGIADGSGIPLEQIIVLNFFNEIKKAYQKIKDEQKSNESGDKGCSTVLLNRQDTDTFAIIHNEDHAIALYYTCYIVEADIHSIEYHDGQKRSPNERFISFCYAGAIPGNGFGANKHGFAFTLNGLYPDYVARGRLPRQIVNRALLSVQNQEDLDNLLRTSPVAYGFSINGGFPRQHNYLFNYEIGANIESDNENYISKCLVINDSQKNDQKHDDCTIAVNYLSHFNHYERLKDLMPQHDSLESTYNRGKRAEEFGEISTIDDALRFLGDEKNQEYPLFRLPSTIDVNSVTLCTACFNFKTNELLVYENNPKDNKQPSLTYDLNKLFNEK